MKNIIKYVCIAMIVIAAWKLPFEIYVVFRNGFSGPAMFTISFASHVFMIITGIMGLKSYDEDERQKMLAGISGMQVLLCLVSVFCDRVPVSLWSMLRNVKIFDWITIICSLVLLVFYIREAVRVKKGNLVNKK